MEEMPHIRHLNYNKGVTLALSLPRCVSTLLPPSKYLTYFTTFCLCGNSFLQSQRTRALSLATGLVARIQTSHCHGPTSPSAAAAAAKLLQSCPTLCDPIDGRPPGSAVLGILQARTLEWVAISLSNA